MVEKELKKKLSKLFEDNFNAWTEIVDPINNRFIKDEMAMTKEVFVNTVSKFIIENFKSTN